MNDYSQYAARIYEEVMTTETLRQQAANEELKYWQRKNAQLEAGQAQRGDEQGERE